MLGRVEGWREYLVPGQDSAEEELLRRDTRSGRPLGSHDFLEALEARTGRPLVPRKRGPKPRSR